MATLLVFHSVLVPRALASIFSIWGRFGGGPPVIMGRYTDTRAVRYHREEP